MWAGKLLTRVHAGLLNVLHDAANDNIAILVAQCIYIQLVCPVQILVHQHRPIWVHLHSILDVPFQILVAVQTHVIAIRHTGDSQTLQAFEERQELPICILGFDRSLPDLLRPL